MTDPSAPSERAAASPAAPAPPVPCEQSPIEAQKRRRRGSRGGRGRPRPSESADDFSADESHVGNASEPSDDTSSLTASAPGESAPMTRPQIGDTRPAPGQSGAGQRPAGTGAKSGGDSDDATGTSANRRRRRKRPTPTANRRDGGPATAVAAEAVGSAPAVVGGLGDDDSRLVLSAEAMERRRGRERNGRPVGRYLMVVHTQPQATQIAVLEGRTLIRHIVSRPQNDTNEIDGNIYLARVQNVLPGMEAAFIDIGTPKNAVLYRGDLRLEPEEIERGKGRNDELRIEQMLKGGQVIVCQVTKNPIDHKGARLTQEVSLPGRFVVLVPGSTTYGISKRLPDDERKRLRRILDGMRLVGHGIIVRTAAEGCDDDELRRDVARLVAQWEQIEELATRAKAPSLLYREPDIAVRFIREELNKDFRSVTFDDPDLYAEVLSYVTSINPELADRIELHDPTADPLPLFERHHVHEQLHKAIDRKVWLPSGGSLIIERTEALTVIDVNTGKNVGKTNLEETVFRNNLEAADEIARQLRLRDIGGIIVIDFIDMEIKANRDQVNKRLREALSRDKTRVQVFDISELGLVEMTRKRVSEGLVESLSATCPMCAGRGFTMDADLLE